MEGGEGSGTMPKHLSAFMTRLHAMVNDPSTDALISWGSSGTSIVIRDHQAFERNILTKFFKHGSLSSFVHQLNNYGFSREKGADKWEYENPYFQRGKESWLANIKSKNQKRKQCSNPTNNELKTELEILKNELEESKLDIEESKLEIEKLMKKQAEMELQIEEIKKTARSEKLTMRNPEIPTENEEMNEIAKPAL